MSQEAGWPYIRAGLRTRGHAIRHMEVTSVLLDLGTTAEPRRRRYLAQRTRRSLPRPRPTLYDCSGRSPLLHRWLECDGSRSQSCVDGHGVGLLDNRGGFASLPQYSVRMGRCARPIVSSAACGILITLSCGCGR